MPRRCASSATSRASDLTQHLADVVVTDAVAGNVVIKFFEGLSAFIFDLWRDEFRRSLRGRLAYLLMRPGIGAHPERLRLRDARRLAVARREGHGHHHPRQRQAADDRLRLRGRRDDGRGARPGPDRRGARRRQRAAGRAAAAVGRAGGHGRRADDEEVAS